MFLLDTNVVSELRKKRPNEHVVSWLRSTSQDELFLSAITIGEIAKGIARQRRVGTDEAGGRADDLQGWLDRLLTDFSDRILAIDVAIATRWGRLCDVHPQLATDMLIAATALDRDLVVATRNVGRFGVVGVRVVNPFSTGGQPS